MYYSSDSDGGSNPKSLDLSYLMLDTESLSQHLGNNIRQNNLTMKNKGLPKHVRKGRKNDQGSTSNANKPSGSSQASAYPDDEASSSTDEERRDSSQNRDDVTEKLFINHNQVVTLPFELVLFQKLKVLDLSNNNIEILNDFILHLPNLTHLFLKNNALRDDSFQKDLSPLNKLKEINLSNNQFTQLPHQLFNISSLSYLYLGDNSITHIHPDIRKLQK